MKERLFRIFGPLVMWDRVHIILLYLEADKIEIKSVEWSEIGR